MASSRFLRLSLLTPALLSLAAAAIGATLLLAKPRPATPRAAGSAEAKEAVAPDFTLPEAASGKLFALSSQRGHPVLVNFWATWCKPCRVEIPELEKASRLHPGCLSVIGVAVNSGDADEIAAFARQHQMSYPVLVDDEQTSDTYQVRMLPRSVLLDAQGKVAGIFEGRITLEDISGAVQRLAPAPVNC